MNTQSVALKAPRVSRAESLAALLASIEGSIPESKSRFFVYDKNTLMLNNQVALQIVKRGIPSKALALLGDFLGLCKVQVAEYLDMDRTTVARHVSKEQNLPMHSAESVLRVIELAKMANDIFASEEDAFAWMRKPHPMLEGDSPFQASKTSFGAQRVKDTLLAIKYGGAV